MDSARLRSDQILSQLECCSSFMLRITQNNDKYRSSRYMSLSNAWNSALMWTIAVSSDVAIFPPLNTMKIYSAVLYSAWVFC
jgi:hypothetical protein